MLIFKKWDSTIIFLPHEEFSAGFRNNFPVSLLEYQCSRNKTKESFLKLAETYDTLCLVVTDEK